jgi:hypothetical protein
MAGTLRRNAIVGSSERKESRDVKRLTPVDSPGEVEGEHFSNGEIL